MPDDILQDTELEPTKDKIGEGEEEQRKDILSEIEPDAVETPKSENDKHREAIILSEIRKVASGEKELDEVPKWCYDEVEGQVKDITAQREDKRLTALEEKFTQRIEKVEEIALKKDLEEDRKNASAILDKFLETSGIDPEEFEKEHKELFIGKVKEEVSSGSSRTRAVKLAIGELYAQGVVPNANDIRIEETRIQGGKFLGGGDSGSISNRELDDINRELSRAGVSPVSPETAKKMKEQGLL